MFFDNVYSFAIIVYPIYSKDWSKTQCLKMKTSLSNKYQFHHHHCRLLCSKHCQPWLCNSHSLEFNGILRIFSIQGFSSVHWSYLGCSNLSSRQPQPLFQLTRPSRPRWLQVQCKVPSLLLWEKWFIFIMSTLKSACFITNLSYFSICSWLQLTKEWLFIL